MPETPLLELAFAMGINPAEIENEWDEYWVNRLLALQQAKAMARSL
jgi:hypothetical protein